MVPDSAVDQIDVQVYISWCICNFFTLGGGLDLGYSPFPSGRIAVPHPVHPTRYQICQSVRDFKASYGINHVYIPDPRYLAAILGSYSIVELPCDTAVGIVVLSAERIVHVA